MDSKKRAKIIIILIGACIIGFPVAWICKSVIHQQRVLIQCPELRQYQTSLEACYGILVIQTQVDDTISKYLINDYKHGLYVVSAINNKNRYRVEGNTMYIIDEREHTGTIRHDNGPIKSIVDVYQNGKVITLEFDNPEDIPNYVTVDINSGEVARYKTINEVPESAKMIFQEINK